MFEFFYEEGLSYRSIQSKLKSSGVSISLGLISNIVHNKGKRRQERVTGVPRQERRCRPKLTKSVLKAVEKHMTKPDPPAQTSLAKQLKVSPSTINNALKELGLQRRKKLKVHTITDRQKKNRCINAWKLYRDHLAGHRYEYVVTLDESWFKLLPLSSKTELFYKRKEETPKEHWVLACKEVMPKKVMLVTGMTARGPLKVRKVPEKGKVNSDFYIRRVLSPMIKNELIPMFGDNINKVFVHHDKAPSHVSRKMTAFAEEMHAKYGITFIKKEHIPVKGADISPMDFHGFGYLKNEINKTRVRTFEGMCKKLAKIWSEVSVKQCQDTYRSWKSRLVQVTKQKGGHIEHIKDIHRHKTTNKQH